MQYVMAAFSQENRRETRRYVCIFDDYGSVRQVSTRILKPYPVFVFHLTTTQTSKEASIDIDKQTMNRGINDFSEGPVWKRIVIQAVPLTIAQLVHLLYNVVDRIYIGHIGDEGNIALTGVGLTFPIVTLIMGFAAWFGVGGVPLFSIARGENNKEKAGRILGNSLTILLISSVVITVFGYVFQRPILFAFGASEVSYEYASAYLNIYLLGTIFSMITTGMNGYINAQGFPRIGMLSIVIGAIVNIIFDPVFIFIFNMGVSGAALATVISQGLSAVWVMMFICGKQVVVPFSIRNMILDRNVVSDIVKLGTSNFMMQGTNCAVQIVCNATLQQYGGDLFVGIMTVVNSIREIFMLPITGIIGGSQPVISYNYGAKKYERVKQGISFNTWCCTIYTIIAWVSVYLLSKELFSIFSEDSHLIETGIEMLRIYFFGFVFMALQFSGQSTFQALGDAKHAIFFSMLRKIIIVVPLTIILPVAGFGVNGVFVAEPVSNVIGGTACYLTMRITIKKKIS